MEWDWLTAHATAPNIGALAGAGSAIAWTWSSLISAKEGVTWLDGPPPEIDRAMRRRALLNAVAALLSGIAAGCTAWMLWRS